MMRSRKGQIGDRHRGTPHAGSTPTVAGGGGHGSGLLGRGLQLSLDKTVALIPLQGSQAVASLRRYCLDNPAGESHCLRFQIEGQNLYVKIVTQHVYLGAIISFSKFEQQSFEHRLCLAKQTYRRLRSVLKCTTVPTTLRLQLWQGTIVPTLLHGLDCTGLPGAEAATLLTQFYKQARAVARSHSMFTHETHADFARRLRLCNPLDRLLRAVTHRANPDDAHDSCLRPGDASSSGELW